MPVALAFVAIAAEGYSIYEQGRAAKQTAAVDTATAGFNAKYDESLATQLDLDTQHNIQVERQDNAVYLSRQAASYAAAGVLATSGSPLHAQITNAGRMEQQIQQQYLNSQQKQEQYHVQAKAGIAQGAAQASADRMSASLAAIDGGVKIARMAYGDYEAGTFG